MTGDAGTAFDIAAIIIGHRDGDAALASLQSFDNAVQVARSAGLRVQAIQQLHDPDSATQALFDRHGDAGTLRRVSTLRDPALARNDAIEAVDAPYVAILDAGDAWSFDWLASAHAFLQASAEPVIAHPQFQFCHGATPRIRRVVDQHDIQFDLDLARLADPWHGLGACRTAILRGQPLCAGDGDAAPWAWAWNLEAIVSGHVHRIVPGSVLFRRGDDASPAVSSAGAPRSGLSRYDSPRYDAIVPALPLATTRDGHHDALDALDVEQLHRLFVGDAPGDTASLSAIAAFGLVALANDLIRSDTFALRLQELLAARADAIAFAPLDASLRAWLKRRLHIVPDAAATPTDIGHALAAVLSTFPFRPIFDEVFGLQANAFRDGLRNPAKPAARRWKAYIDQCSASLIRGWVFAQDWSPPSTVAVRIDGMLAGICVASVHRPDVAGATGTPGFCGFELVPVIDWSLALAPTLQVTLHDVATGDLIPTHASMRNPRCAPEPAGGAVVDATGDDTPDGILGTASVHVDQYDQLLARHHLPAVPAPDASLAAPARISVVVHAEANSVQALDATLQSVLGQTHAALQLVIVVHGDVDYTSNLDGSRRATPIRVATVPAAALAADTFARVLDAADGDQLCFVESGCVLDPSAIAWFGYAAQRYGARISYADDVSVFGATAADRRCQAELKPVFDYDLLLQCDYISAVFCASRADLAAIASRPKAEGASRQYDLLLQLIEQVPERCIFHLPLPLHARRFDETLATQAQAGLGSERRHAAERHLLRSGAVAVLREAGADARLDWNDRCHPHWSPPTPRQRLAIIIPTRDRVELLKASIDSLHAHMAAPDACRLLVMDNGSEDASTLAYLDELRRRDNVDVIRSDGPFNWSALNNSAVAEVDTELVLFANNDIEVFTPGFDDILRGLLRRPDVGAVGTLLLYPGGAIQHAGTAIGIHGVADHIAARRMPTDRGPARIARYQRSVGAVTGAFLAMRRETFIEVGGFDETDLRIAFSDVDLCLKIGDAGLRVIYTPRIVCLHHESASRGIDTVDPAKQARADAEIRVLKQRWGRRLSVDLHYNPSFDRYEEPFTRVAMPNRAMVVDHLQQQQVRPLAVDGPCA